MNYNWNSDGDGEECEDCGHVHGDGPGAHMRGLIEAVMNAETPEEREAALNVLFASVLQYGYFMTIDVTDAVRGALMAAGHKRLAWLVRQMVITKAMSTDTLVMGAHMKQKFVPTEYEKDAVMRAVVDALWVHGWRVHLDEEQAIVFDGKVDDLFESMEDTVADFVNDLDKELGDSIEEPERGTWW